MPIVRIDKEDFRVSDVPEECPRCHKSILVLNHECGVEVTIEAVEYLQAVFRCPACKLLFFGTYQEERNAFKLQFVEPKMAVKVSFGLVEELSPQFSVIFNQAAKAEAYRLDAIAGMAYRKSLEYLIKDYCISLNPTDGDAIKKEFLGQVIRDRIQDKKIQLAAQKATWLGNDEAHYVRDWLNHDIQDLKNLIRITVSGISEALEYEAYMTSFAKKSTSENAN
jgi:hypothetical protein